MQSVLYSLHHFPATDGLVHILTAAESPGQSLLLMHAVSFVAGYNDISDKVRGRFQIPIRDPDNGNTGSPNYT